MPFHVRLADHEEPHLRPRQSHAEGETSGTMRELFRGISFGLGLLAVLLAAYAVYAHVSSFPTLQMLLNYWFGWR